MEEPTLPDNPIPVPEVQDILTQELIRLRYRVGVGEILFERVKALHDSLCNGKAFGLKDPKLLALLTALDSYQETLDREGKPNEHVFAGEVPGIRADFDWQMAALTLWHLLDDIDTCDDAARDNDAAFRTMAMKYAHKRNLVLESLDGYTLSEPFSRLSPSRTKNLLG